MADSLFRRELRACLLLAPFPLLFSAVFIALLLIFGGQNVAHLGAHDQCSDNSLIPYHARRSWGAQFGSVHVLLQISDLHVNSIDNGRAKRVLAAFVETELPVWENSASALLVSGDLVNSKLYPRNHLHFLFGGNSRQIEAEWAWLAATAKIANASVPWIGVHGNHDSFGGKPNSLSCTDLSVHPCGSGYRAFQFRAAESLYVVGLDGTLETPFHSPLNFFGDASVSSSQLDAILRRIEAEQEITDSTDIIVFSHYPSSVMAGGQNIQKQAAALAAGRRPRYAAHLSGHLHTLNGPAYHGLQAVSRSGALELELPDMITQGAFRGLVFDHGILSFRDFKVQDSDGQEDEGELRETTASVIVTNPPRAGLCGAGAGAAALRSTHIRLFIPYASQAATTHLDVKVFIDDKSIGLAERVPGCESFNNSGTCRSMFVVEWDPAVWDDSRAHTLVVMIDGREATAHEFALRGHRTSGFHAAEDALLSAIFVLSDFESIAMYLFYIGLLTGFLFSTISVAIARSHGNRSRGSKSELLIAMAAFLAFSPLIVANSLVDYVMGWGVVGVHTTWLPGGAVKSGVDPVYYFAFIIWRSYVAVAFVHLLEVSGNLATISGSFVLAIFAWAVVFRSAMWCFEVIGSYGLAAAIVSPSCIALSVCTSWFLYTDIRIAARRKARVQKDS